MANPSTEQLYEAWMSAKKRLEELECIDRCVNCGKEGMFLLDAGLGVRCCVGCYVIYTMIAKEQDRTVRPREKGYCYRCGLKFKGSVKPQTIDGEQYCAKCVIWHREVELPRREARLEVQRREVEWERASEEEGKEKRREEVERTKAAMNEVECIEKRWAEANIGNPRDAYHYLQLGGVLLAELAGGAGVGMAIDKPATSWVSHWSGEGSPEEKGKPYAKPRAQTHALPVLIEAANNYLKAISLGIGDPYDSGCAKLTYAKLLCLLDWDGCEHYARDAEKDFRKQLRSVPDYVPALEKMVEAVWMYEASDRTRTQRVESLRARIEEAKTRNTLGVPGRAQTLPGDAESPYPENWSTLAESVRKRDGYRCSQCGAQNVELHVHHIVPLSKGGGNDLDNLITLCDYCHGEIHPRMGR